MNTRSKRASSAGILLPFLLHPVAPDGTIDAGDRQHIAWNYSGIAAGSPIVLGAADAASTWRAEQRQTTWTAESRQTDWSS